MQINSRKSKEQYRYNKQQIDDIVLQAKHKRKPQHKAQAFLTHLSPSKNGEGSVPAKKEASLDKKKKAMKNVAMNEA